MSGKVGIKQPNTEAEMDKDMDKDMDRQVVKFDGRREFEQQLRLCLARAEHTLQLFDPDFSLWLLGASDVEAILRTFLVGKGRLQLATHSNAHLERDCPRLLRLLHDFGHLIECRLTPKHLRQLTDSFCIADGRHIVRRFHSDHLRGEAAFDSPVDTELSTERFHAMWAESVPGLHVSTTGL
ncbi:MAG: hypothetical protein V4754_04160 [Pseudomonadota bacterium]